MTGSPPPRPSRRAGTSIASPTETVAWRGRGRDFVGEVFFEPFDSFHDPFGCGIVGQIVRRDSGSTAGQDTDRPGFSSALRFGFVEFPWSCRAGWRIATVDACGDRIIVSFFQPLTSSGHRIASRVFSNAGPRRLVRPGPDIQVLSAPAARATLRIRSCSGIAGGPRSGGLSISSSSIRRPIDIPDELVADGNGMDDDFLIRIILRPPLGGGAGRSMPFHPADRSPDHWCG